MGKIFSRFKFLKSSTSRTLSQKRATYGVESDFDDYNNTDANKNNTELNNMAKKLHEVNNFPDFDNILNVNCSPNLSTCMFGQADYSVQLFDYVKNKKIKTWKGHVKDVTKVIYCSKIDRYLSSSRDKTIKMWSLSNSSSEMNMQGHELVVTSIASDPENNYLMSGSRDNILNLWDLSNGKLVLSANISRNLITDLCWSNDGKLLIQTSEDKENRLWDPCNLKVLHTFPKQQYIQSSCHISSDNNYAISTSNGFEGNGCEITIFDLRMRSVLTDLRGHVQTVTSAKFIKSNQYIVSCSNDSTVCLWDFNKQAMIENFYLQGSLTGISESYDSRNLVVSSVSNGLFLLGI